MSTDRRHSRASAALPPGSVRALLGGGRVTVATRNALEARLDRRPGAPPRFFDGEAFSILRAVCARLVGLEEASDPGHAVDVAGGIDARLADGRGDGWRYDEMPPDGEAFRRGLQGIDQTAHALHGSRFTDLDSPRQDAVLQALAAGSPPGEAWKAVSPARFFEELRTEVAETYFAHPLVQERIGYLGFADKLGWHALGLDESEQPEPPRG